MKFPGVVAVLCVVPSGLVLHIGITSCTFPPWAEMSKKNRYELIVCKPQCFLIRSSADIVNVSLRRHVLNFKHSVLLETMVGPC